MEKNDGGPAFPVLAFQHNHEGQRHPAPTNEPGMALRDYFAAKAMQGILTVSANQTASAEVAAEFAYKFADAMLAERSKP